MAKLKFAVIGLGWVATHRHLPWLMRNPEIEVVGMLDRSPEKVRAAAKQFPHLLTAVSEDGRADWLKDVDAVTIATNPPTHYHLSKSLLQQGKHVLVEKPMAMKVEEAEDLVRLAQTQNKIQAVVHNFQFERSIQLAKRLLADGELGQLLGIEAVQLSNPRRRLPEWYEELPLGLFYDESPHLLYLLRSIVKEEPQFISAQVVKAVERRNTPACVNCLFTSDGIPLRVSMNFNSTLSEWHLILLGSRQIAIADIFRDILVVAPNDGLHRAQDILRTSLRTFQTHVWGTLSSGLLLVLNRLSYGNDEIVARFVGAIRSGIPPQGISAVDGLRVVELQNRIAQSSPVLLKN